MMIRIVFLIVTMRWNGTDITGIPTFIYHDELATSIGNITDPNGQGSLICSSVAQTTIVWKRVDEVNVNFHNKGSFQQIGSPNLSQLALGNGFNSTPRIESFINGLWCCTTSGARLHVGIYTRVPGKTE